MFNVEIPPQFREPPPPGVDVPVLSKSHKKRNRAKKARAAKYARHFEELVDLREEKHSIEAQLQEVQELEKIAFENHRRELDIIDRITLHRAAQLAAAQREAREARVRRSVA